MTIHHWFIPNKKNKFHPMALRPAGLMVFLAVFVTIPFLYNVTSAKQAQVLGYATNISVSDVSTLSNQQRLDNGLPALNLDGQLTSAAQAKAANMFAEDYWAHVAPDGTTPWAFIYGAGYNYSFAGENLAKDFNTSAGVVNAWMASPEHKANILSSNYQDVGYAVVNGVLLGSETTLVVAMYGQRVAVPAPAPAPTQPAAPTTVAKTNTNTQATVPETTTTPVVTPDPVTTTQASPASSPTSNTTTQQKESATPVKEAASDDLNGLVKGIATSVPIRAYTSLNWGQKASILLLLALMLLFIMKHTLIWRAQRRGIRHIWLRAHPIGQIAVLSTVLVLTFLSGVGTIL